MSYKTVTVKCTDRGHLNLLRKKYITNKVVQILSLVLSIISALQGSQLWGSTILSLLE